jgi:hypothetical protein
VTLGKRWRLRVLEARVKGAEFIEVGGGRRIAMTPAERYATLIDALAGEDTPTIQAIRSGMGKPDRGGYADLIQNLSLRDRTPPSGSWESPWIDSPDSGSASPAQDLPNPEEFRP